MGIVDRRLEMGNRSTGGLRCSLRVVGARTSAAGEGELTRGQGWSGQGDWKGYEVTNILKPVL